MSAKKSAKLRLSVYGVRGSYAVPGPGTVKIGGNTTCYCVEAGEHTIILDAGTGIISLGAQLAASHRAGGKPVVATILISHTHHDHTQGFPFFTPVYFGSSQLFMFGPNTHYLGIEEALAQGLAAPYFPVNLQEMQCVKSISAVGETQELLFYPGQPAPELRNRFHDKTSQRKPAVLVRTLHGCNHPKNGVLHFRIQVDDASIVYATDTEGYIGGDHRLIEFARGADLLIHDAQYLPSEYTGGAMPKQGWGHSTYEMACEVAKAAGVKKLLLHHHDPLRVDSEVLRIEKLARKLFPNAEAAREGAVYAL